MSGRPSIGGAILRWASGSALFLVLNGCETTPEPPAELLQAWEAASIGEPPGPEMFTSPDVAMRREAARLAAATDPTARAEELIGRLIDDDDPTVRYRSMFALGQAELGDRLELVESQLLEILQHDDSPSARLVAAQSLGRIGTHRALDPIETAIHGDAEPAVRGAAALAATGLLGDARRGRGPVEGISDERQVAFFTELATQCRFEKDPKARWRMIYTLAHSGREEARAGLTAAARGSTEGAGRWAVLFGIRGLALLDADPATQAALIELTSHRDDEVAIEALDALRRIGKTDPETVDAAKRAVKANAPLVRAQACRLLGALDGTGPLLSSPTMDKSATVRGAAILALTARTGDAAVLSIDEMSGADDWQTRVAATKAAGMLSTELAMPRLEAAWRDDDVRVRTAVVTSLGKHLPAGDELLKQAIQTGDLAIVEEAIGIIRNAGDPKRIELLHGPYGAEYPDVDPSSEHDDLARLAFDAWQELAENAGGEFWDAFPKGPFDAPLPTGPALGRDVPVEFIRSRPKLAVHTTRGRFEITLAPLIAPVHCWNFVQLASEGSYDGRLFHRVVPNFVVQGADARGDGYGNTSWLGGKLRDEISPMPFLPGTVGMPKSDDHTGGDQFFVTTLPAPHLDGEYTAFGMVTRGLSVVESIEVGDRIERIELITP